MNSINNTVDHRNNVLVRSKLLPTRLKDSKSVFTIEKFNFGQTAIFGTSFGRTYSFFYMLNIVFLQVRLHYIISINLVKNQRKIRINC